MVLVAGGAVWKQCDVCGIGWLVWVNVGGVRGYSWCWLLVVPSGNNVMFVGWDG